MAVTYPALLPFYCRLTPDDFTSQGGGGGGGESAATQWVSKYNRGQNYSHMIGKCEGHFFLNSGQNFFNLIGGDARGGKNFVFLL